MGGTHHLSFTQSVNGVSVFGNGVKAHVDRRGRLIQVDGSPVANLPTSLKAPKIGAVAARTAAAEAVFGKANGTATRTRSGRGSDHRLLQR